MPEDTFTHTDPEANLSVRLEMKQGDNFVPVPDWIDFDNSSMQVSAQTPGNVCDLGVACSATAATLEFRAVATDQWGGQAATNFKFNVGINSQ